MNLSRKKQYAINAMHQEFYRTRAVLDIEYGGEVLAFSGSPNIDDVLIYMAVLERSVIGSLDLPGFPEWG